MALLALIILRLPSLWIPVLDADEAIYGLFSRIWFDGGIPYVNCVETKPLGIYFFYGVIFSLFGKFNMIAVHAATIAVVGATACVINLIARITSHEPRATGFWAALLYIVFSTTYIPKYIATTIEPIMLLAVVVQYYLWLRYEGEGRRSLAFLSGLAFSAACLFKYQAGMNLFILVAYLGIVKPLIIRRETRDARREKSVRSYWRNWSGFPTFIAGAIPLPAIMLAYLWYAGALDGFIFWNITGNAQYIGAGAESINVMGRVLTRVLPYIVSTALIWVLAAIQLCKFFRTTHDARRTTAEWLIILWLILSFVPVSMGHRFYGHYFLLLLPPMAVLASPVLESIWASGRKWIKWTALFWIVFPAAGFLAARFFISDIHRAVGEEALEDYRPLAAYVAHHTKPDDRIIAWGFAPLIYWYSERLPATRFFWSDLLVGRVPGLRGEEMGIGTPRGMPEAWDMFMADLEKNRPAYIIDTSPANFRDYKYFPPSKYPRIMDYLGAHYREETAVNKSVFYRRIDGY